MATIETVDLYHKKDGHKITVNADEADQFSEYQKTKPSGGGGGSKSSKKVSTEDEKTEEVDAVSDNKKTSNKQ